MWLHATPTSASAASQHIRKSGVAGADQASDKSQRFARLMPASAECCPGAWRISRELQQCAVMIADASHRRH